LNSLSLKPVKLESLRRGQPHDSAFRGNMAAKVRLSGRRNFNRST
jgi:hypothetical protein